MDLAAVNDEYSPERIGYWLSGGRCSRGQCNWADLESRAVGGTGSNMDGGTGGGVRADVPWRKWSDIKADLEHAADQLPIYWQATRLIFSRQHRYSVWLSRWTRAGCPTEGPSMEPLDLPAAFEHAVWRMSTSLGWSEGQAA